MTGGSSEPRRRRPLFVATLNVAVCTCALAALLLLGGRVGHAQVATPGLIHFRGMASTEDTIPLGTKTGNTCLSAAYCTQNVDPTSQGNTLIVFYTYMAVSGGNVAIVPTVTDDLANTYTPCGPEANNATNHMYLGCAYTLSTTAGTRAVTVTWGGTCPGACVSNVSVGLAEVFNVTALDTYATNSGTAQTTFTSGSATSTANNDLWFEFACGTSTRVDVGTWTLGSQAGITWVADLADRRDACMIQHGVQPTAGALNPQLTTATSNNYAALGVAFTAGVHGVAQTGMRVVNLYSVSTGLNLSPGTVTYQFPLSGNLGVVMATGDMVASAVSDSINGAWTSCGPANVAGSIPAGTSMTFFKANATPGLATITMTIACPCGNTTVGDLGPILFFDIADAAPRQLCNRAANQGHAPTGITTLTTTPAAYGYAPSSSAGMSFFAGAFAGNTGISILSPPGSFWDLNTFGGESLSGPEPVEENNLGGSHLNFTSAAGAAVSWGVTDAATDVGIWATDSVSFQAPGAILYPSQVKQGAGSALTSGSSLALSYTPFQATDLLALLTCSFNTSGTITVSDGTNTWVQVDGPVALNNSIWCATFYAANVSASAVTITATFGGGATTQRWSLVQEFANATTLDQHNLANATSDATTGILIGTATATTTRANEVIFGAATCGGCDLPSGSGTALYNTGSWTNNVFDGLGNVAGYHVVSSPGAFAAQFIDSQLNWPDSVAIMTFYNGGPIAYAPGGPAPPGRRLDPQQRVPR